MMLLLIYFLTLLMFGSTWVAVKIGLETLPPLTGAVIRFVIAFVLLSLVFRAWKFRLPSRRTLKRDLVLAGVVMYGVNFALIYIGQAAITASLAAVLFATMPFFTGLFAHIMLPAERLTPRLVVGQLVGFSGVIVLFSEDLTLSGPFWGMLALVLSSASCAWATVKIKRDLADVNPVHLSIVLILPGLALLTPLAVMFEVPWQVTFDAAAVGSIFYLAIGGTGAAFIGWYYLLKRLSATALSLMTFLEPLVAIALGYLLLGELLTPLFAIGGALILTGVLVASLPQRQRRPLERSFSVKPDAPPE